MSKLIKILITGFLFSLFLFPVYIPFMPAANTKMIVAAMGGVILILDRSREKTFSVSTDFLLISLLAIGFSLWTYFSIVYNHTSDDVFTDYCISLWVWLGGAYFIVQLIRAVHGEATIERIGNYMIGVCVFQCVVALAACYSPFIKQIADSSLAPGALNMFEGRSERLHGFGAAFDPSGLRMAAVLVIDTFLLCQAIRNYNRLGIILYIASFVTIFTIGNMIARSTTVGAGIGIFVAVAYFWQHRSKEVNLSPLLLSVFILLAGIGVFILMYLFSPEMQKHFRFGLEGFFSFFETGKWHVHSNDILKNMIVWPEDLRTWIIGDGYCMNPKNDPNFLGEIIGGFYMGTDIGYLRLIFYSGVPGLLLMLGIFIKATTTCIRNLPNKYALLFMSLLLSNIAGWFKVMSDIIMVFAPFLIMAYMQAENKEKQSLLTNA